MLNLSYGNYLPNIIVFFTALCRLCPKDFRQLKYNDSSLIVGLMLWFRAWSMPQWTPYLKYKFIKSLILKFALHLILGFTDLLYHTVGGVTSIKTNTPFMFHDKKIMEKWYVFHRQMHYVFIVFGVLKIRGKKYQNSNTQTWKGYVGLNREGKK